MDYREIISELWKRCKMCFPVLFVSMITMVVLNTVRLGRFLPKKKGDLTGRLREFTNDIHLCFDIFHLQHEQVSRRLNGTEPILSHFDSVKFAAVRKGDEILVVIRGSNNLENWMDNFNTDMSYRSKYGHSHEAYTHIASGIHDILIAHFGSFERARVVGGSLGGAIAVLLGRALQSNDRRVKVIAVAAPKVTRSNYNLDVTHIRHEQDPVPYLPLWNPIQRYDHDGETLLIKRSGKVYQFDNGWGTDMSLSVLMLEESLDPSVHMEYRKYV